MSKQCEIVRDLLPLYVDKACSEASLQMVKEHLEVCDACRDIYQHLSSHTNEDILKREKVNVIKHHRKTAKRKILLASLLSVLACVSIIIACTNLKTTTIDYGVSERYSKADMDFAIELIREKFDSWEGCKLYSITYTNDDFCERELNYCNTLVSAEGRTTYDDCIVFRTSFRSPVFGGGAWNANCKYDWSWYLARTQSGEWELLTWGMP